MPHPTVDREESYSAIIVFAGAEVTALFTRHYGCGIKPDEYAMPKQEKAV